MTFETLWEEPNCEPLGRVSYTEWSRVRACVLRSAFARQPKSRTWERGSTWTAVGNARHRLLEEIQEAQRDGRGAPSAIWVRTRFDALLGFERAQLLEQWSPAAVPPVKRWPDPVFVKARMAHELGIGENDSAWPDPESPVEMGGPAGYSRPTEVVHATAPGRGSYRVEEWLSDEVRNLHGRVDRLENRDGHLVVVDFKTGIGTPSEELQTRHRDQMLFYAGLVEAVYSEWPLLELHPASGPPISISYTPADVEQLRGVVDQDRTNFNVALEAGALTSSSQPSLTACSWCPFQVVCPALVSEWNATVSPSGPPSRAISLVAGRVTTVREAPLAKDVVINQPADLSVSAGEVYVTRLPVGLGVDPGDFIVIAGAEIAGGPRVLRARWDSRVRVVPAGAMPDMGVV